MRERILVVDDEKSFREGMALYLHMEGFEVIEAENGERALECFRKQPPDLVVLDVMLPDMNGIDICQEIRKTSDVPVIFLTALEDDDYFMMGYRAGGDDYIAKPFKASILTMKIRRILKKTVAGTNRLIKFGKITLDTDNYSCMAEGKAIPLTPNEFTLLVEFIRNSGRVLTRNYLLNTIWGYDFDGESRVVDNTVARLRKKIAGTGVGIKAVISAGYKLEALDHEP